MSFIAVSVCPEANFQSTLDDMAAGRAEHVHT